MNHLPPFTTLQANLQHMLYQTALGSSIFQALALLKWTENRFGKEPNINYQNSNKEV